MSTAFIMIADHRPGSKVGSSFSPRVNIGPVPWLPWTSSQPVATAAREHEFVRTLERMYDGEPLTHGRSDVTMVLNGLRGGLSVEALRHVCPGIRPARLLAAYRMLEARRSEAARAWSALVEQPTVESLERYGDEAACLVPVLVNRLREAATIDARMLPQVADYLVTEVDQVDRLVRNSELEIDRQPGDARAIEISRTLYDPTSDCIFARPDHLPERVGSLVPTRVAALLHERDVTSLARAVA